MADPNKPSPELTQSEIFHSRFLAQATGITERQALELIRLLGTDRSSLLREARLLKTESPGNRDLQTLLRTLMKELTFFGGRRDDTATQRNELERERQRLIETDEHIADREQRVDVLRLLIERMTMNRQDSAAARLTLGGLEHQLEDWYDHGQLICERNQVSRILAIIDPQLRSIPLPIPKSRAQKQSHMINWLRKSPCTPEPLSSSTPQKALAFIEQGNGEPDVFVHILPSSARACAA